MPAIPPHDTAVVDEPWDGPAEEAKLSNDAGAATYRRMYAWRDSEGDADTKAAYKFPHHQMTDSGPGAANLKGVRNALARLPQADIPEGDREGVRRHLQRHLDAQDGGGDGAAGERRPLVAGGVRTGQARAYHHVVRAILETPWAILPSAFAAIREVVALRLEGVKLSAEEVSERVASGPGAKEPYEVDAGPRTQGQGGVVAVLPIYGTIFPRANLFAEISGGTSMERFGAAIDAAANDPQVGSIVLDVNSPGGSVDLLPETAAKIRAARQKKRVVAVANTLAASAAYWLASQADELVVTPSGMVGSIGVIAAHDDASGFFEQLGVRTSLIAAGKYKTEGNPYEPLSDEGRAAIQAIVDEYYGMFVADVARGRGVGRKAVREGFGEGRVVTAGTALEQGMVDSVETFDAALARVMRGKALKPAAAADAMEDPGEPELVEGIGAAALHAGLDQESEYTLALARLRT